MTLEVKIEKRESPFNEPLRAWASNWNWAVIVQETSLGDDFGREQRFNFRCYAVPLTLDGNAYASAGGSSIVEAVQRAQLEFGEFDSFDVRFKDNSLLVLNNFAGQWNWSFKNATNGKIANGSFFEDHANEALARGIIAAQAHITQT